MTLVEASLTPELLAEQQQLDGSSTTPLYLQIRQCLLAALDRGSFAERLPSERDLAAAFAVNRRTVRQALAGLVAERRVVRTVRGTRTITPLPDQTALPGDAGVHPLQRLAFGVARPPVRRQTVRLAIFETSPWQQEFWSRACERCNRADPALQLELVWVDADVGSLDAYRAYLERSGCDLVQLNTSMAGELAQHGELRPLPAEAVAALRDPGLLEPARGGHHDPRWTVPVHLGLPLILANRRLFPGPLPTGADLATAVARVCAAQPAGLALHQPRSLLMLRGTPGRKLDTDELRGELRAVLDLAAILRPAAARVTLDEDHWPFHNRPFLSGASALHLSYAVGTLGALRGAGFPWTATVPLPPPGRCLSAGISLLGVRAGSALDDAALTSALRFWLSAAAQDLIAELGVNCPVRRASVPRLQERHGIAGLDAWLAQPPPDLPSEALFADWGYVGRYALGSALAAAIAGPVDEATLAADLLARTRQHWPAVLR